MKTKQVIVMRTDLNMRKGKMCAQAAHASMKVLLDRMQRNKLQSGMQYQLNATKEMQEWLDGKFTKIVVGCNSLIELHGLCCEALIAEIPAAIIRDNGATEFKEPTFTALAIGPAEAEEIDRITKHLKLL